MYIDSHCHLTFPELHARLPEVRAAMAAAQVSRALCICTTLEEFPRVHALATVYDNFWCSVGVHPDNEGVQEPGVDDLVQRAALPRVVAIGETGLDYYRLNGRSVADMAWQRERYRVFHCFTETMEVAMAALELGFHISFSGIVTFRNAQALREVARAVPLTRCLIETDSPYLAPVPYRGKTNQPAWVEQVAVQLAALKQLPLEVVARATSANAEALFGMRPSGDLPRYL
jgi:TatD DNase family protein